MAKRRSRSRNSGILTLSAPKEITWVIAVIAGGLGMLDHFGVLSVGVTAVVLLMIAFVILAVATAVEGL